MNIQLFPHHLYSSLENRRIFNVDTPTLSDQIPEMQAFQRLALQGAKKAQSDLDKKVTLQENIDFKNPDSLNQSLLETFAGNAGTNISDIKEWIKGSAHLQSQYITVMARGESVIGTHDRPIEHGIDMKTSIMPKEISKRPENIGKAILFIENDNTEAYSKNTKILFDNMGNILAQAKLVDSAAKIQIQKIWEQAQVDQRAGKEVFTPPQEWILDIQKVIKNSYKRQDTDTYRDIGFPVDGKFGPRSRVAFTNFFQGNLLKSDEAKEKKPKISRNPYDTKRGIDLENIRNGEEMDEGGELEAKVYNKLKDLTEADISNVTRLVTSLHDTPNKAKINIDEEIVELSSGGYKIFTIQGFPHIFTVYEGKPYIFNNGTYKPFTENDKLKLNNGKIERK